MSSQPGWVGGRGEGVGAVCGNDDEDEGGAATEEFAPADAERLEASSSNALLVFTAANS